MIHNMQCASSPSADNSIRSLVERAAESCVIIEPPYPYRGETVMSNFDHRVRKDKEARLRVEEVTMDYPAKGFLGWVWWDRSAEQFRCLVNRYREHIETVTKPTLEEIMTDLCDKYGDE